MYLSCAEAVK